MTDPISARLRDQQTKFMTPILGQAADHIDAQAAKIKALEAELAQWKHAVGHLLAAVPVSEIVGVGGSITDLANWMKAKETK